MPSLARLNRSLLESGRVRASSTRPLSSEGSVRILQIGDGNFLRAFADWMIDLANDAGVMNARVMLAAARGPGAVPGLKAQDGLFTVLSRGMQNGKLVDERRIVSCVDSVIDPSCEWHDMRAAAVMPGLRFVISNTTEAGIAHVEEAYAGSDCPKSFPAKLANLLWARYQALGDGAGTGLIILPCELVEANGSKLRRIVLQHAASWALPAEFSAWVEQHNHFLNTLVDRIVPGFPSSELDGLQADLGYADELMVAAEPFHLWVIEGPKTLAEEFPLHKAGLNVIWTDDLKPFRSSKVRVLNGAHTASALAAFGAGLDTVKSMIDDPVISKYLDTLMFEEIVPFVPLPEAERTQYAKTILERFANPYIRHELISIALNSVSKWQVRVLPTVKDHAREHGSAPKLLAFSLAALLAFYQGRFDANGAYLGERDGKPYPIKDNSDVIDLMAEAWRSWQPGSDVGPLVRSVLADARLWGEDLNQVPGLAAQVAASLARIKADGVKKAIGELC